MKKSLSITLLLEDGKNMAFTISNIKKKLVPYSCFNCQLYFDSWMILSSSVSHFECGISR